MPERKATWHVVRCNGEVLLERRAGDGLWGGLWVFPEIRPARLKGLALEPFEHGFTHFRLRVTPILYDVKKKKPDGGWWVPIADALAGAVPTPVRKVLKALPAARR